MFGNFRVVVFSEFPGRRFVLSIVLCGQRHKLVQFILQCVQIGASRCHEPWKARERPWGADRIIPTGVHLIVAAVGDVMCHLVLNELNLRVKLVESCHRRVNRKQQVGEEVPIVLRVVLVVYVRQGRLDSHIWVHCSELLDLQSGGPDYKCWVDLMRAYPQCKVDVCVRGQIFKDVEPLIVSSLGHMCCAFGNEQSSRRRCVTARGHFGERTYPVEVRDLVQHRGAGSCTLLRVWTRVLAHQSETSGQRRCGSMMAASELTE